MTAILNTIESVLAYEYKARDLALLFLGQSPTSEALVAHLLRIQTRIDLLEELVSAIRATKKV